MGGFTWQKKEGRNPDVFRAHARDKQGRAVSNQHMRLRHGRWRATMLDVIESLTGVDASGYLIIWAERGLGGCAALDCMTATGRQSHQRNRRHCAETLVGRRRGLGHAAVRCCRGKTMAPPLRKRGPFLSVDFYNHESAASLFGWWASSRGRQ